MGFQLFAFAASQGFRDGQPGGKGGKACSGLKQGQHGPAAFLIGLDVERGGDAGAASGECEAAFGMIESAGLRKFLHFRVVER